MLGIWNALTATGRLLVLGATEAWGFWLATIPLVLLFLFIASMLNGIVWRMIEGRLKPKLRDREAEAKLNATIVNLKAQLFDAQRTIDRLTTENAEQARVIEANRNWARHLDADAGRVVGAHQ
jgi:uncharacterized membrane protein (UPF0127 family)